MTTDQKVPDWPEESWRAPSPQEVAVFDLLFAEDFPGRDNLALQARTALVRQIDREGSLGFQADGPKATVRGRVPVEGRYHEDATQPWGPAVNLLLHVVDGRLRELEIYKDDGSDITVAPFDVPHEQIEVWSH